MGGMWRVASLTAFLERLAELLQGKGVVGLGGS